jgi:hypothetical protein
VNGFVAVAIGKFNLDAVVKQFGLSVAGDLVHFVEAFPGESHRSPVTSRSASSAPKAISPRSFARMVIDAGAPKARVPSTEKCSVLKSRFAPGRAKTALRNFAAISPSSSRSRFLEN